MITGSVRHASVSAPASSDVPSFITTTNSARPKSPYTIEGTPAMFAIESRMMRVPDSGPGVLGEVDAAPMPTGIAKTAVHSVSMIVP